MNNQFQTTGILSQQSLNKLVGGARNLKPSPQPISFTQRIAPILNPVKQLSAVNSNGFIDRALSPTSSVKGNSSKTRSKVNVAFNHNN